MRKIEVESDGERRWREGEGVSDGERRQMEGEGRGVK